MFSQGWAGLYMGGALLVAVAMLVLANRRYGQDPAYRPVRPAMAIVVGALWPVLVIGAAQLLVLHIARARARGQDARVIEIAGGGRAARPAAAIPTWRISA